MLLHRTDGEDELLRDAGVGAVLGHQTEHLTLARRQAVERIVRPPAREEQRYDFRIERGSTLRHTPHGVDEVGDVEDAPADVRNARYYTGGTITNELRPRSGP